MWLVGGSGGRGKVAAARQTAAILAFLLSVVLAAASHGSGCGDQSANQRIAMVDCNLHG